MKDRKDSVVPATSSTLNDNQDRRDASTENVSQRSTQLGLKTSKSGFPIAKAEVLDRATATSPPAGKLKPALMENTKPTAASHIPTERLSESDDDVTKTHASDDVTFRARRLVNRVPRKSRERAFNAFRTFTLSRFPAEQVPENYLTGDSAKDPAAVAKTQKKLIENSLAAAKDLDTDNAGMTLSFPRDEFDKINAQLGGKLNYDGSGNIELSKLLNLMQPRMNGAAFYASGNGELKRLTAETQYRAQAKTIVDSIMNRGNAKSQAATQSGKTGCAPEESVRAEKERDES